MVLWYWRGNLVTVGNSLEFDKSRLFLAVGSLILDTGNVDTNEGIDFSRNFKSNQACKILVHKH